jgi:hypothetical protein
MYTGMILISNINTTISKEMIVYKTTDQNHYSETQSKPRQDAGLLASTGVPET